MARSAEGWKLVLDERTGIHFVRFRHAGRRHKLSTGQRDSVEAAQRAARIYAEVVSDRWRPGQQRLAPVQQSAARVALDETSAKWLAHVESSLDSTTFDQYAMYVRAHWVAFFSNRMDRLTTTSIDDYKAQRLRRVKRGTLNKELSALRGFVAWAKRRGYLAELPEIKNPGKKVTGTPDTTRRHKAAAIPLDDDEVEAIIKHLPEWSHGKRGGRFSMKARFEVLWHTGLRPATLGSLRAPEDYRQGAMEIQIRDDADKARYGRALPIDEAARAALDRVCPEAGLIFGPHDYRVTLRKAALAAGLPPEKAERISDYDFRHGRITRFYESSNNTLGAMYLAGHKNLSTADNYIHLRRKAAQEVLAACATKDGKRSGRRDPKEGKRGRSKASTDGSTA